MQQPTNPYKFCGISGTVRKLKLPERRKTEVRLDQNDIQLIQRKGLDGVKSQVEKVIDRKLAEGSEVPPRGNPVYKAMKACGADSLEQLRKTHGVGTSGELTDSEKEAVANLLTRWIVREFNYYREEMSDQRKIDEY